MDLNTIIPVTISVGSPSITRLGFGEPGIFGYVPTTVIAASAKTKRYSTSTGLVDLVADGFATTDPVYLAAQAVAAQTPRPPTFKILCGRSTFTHDFDIAPSTFEAGETIEFTLTKGGVSRTYTRTAAGGSLAAEATAIAALLEADVLGWGAAGNTVEFVSAGVGDVVQVRAVVPGPGENGLWYVSARTNCTYTDQSADRGIAAEMTAILAADADWYMLIPADAFGAAELALLATSIQSATNKTMCAMSQDAAVIAGTGIGATLVAADRTRTMMTYSGASLKTYLSAGIAGRFLPETPGSEAWMYKSISGPIPDALTTSESSLAHADYTNTYEGISVGGVTVVNGNLYKGWTCGSSETFIDQIRLIDALVFEVQSRVLALFRASRKVPYTDKGIGQIKGAVLAAIRAYQPNGFVTGSEFCEVPKAADISAIDKATRTLPDVVFGATLSGAIATVTIAGTLEY
jgi:hypothetical protein